ncbi:MAG: hypothetical protein IPF68_15885 [Bacteroidales bacterium]|nr:hypothetical protein [Bacteroidales bacterium]
MAARSPPCRPFALWLDGFGVTGGCAPAFTNGTPVAPGLCGGSTLVTWTVTDHCYVTSTHTATFTIVSPTRGCNKPDNFYRSILSAYRSGSPIPPLTTG